MAKAKKIVDVSNLAKEGDEVVLKNGKTIKEGKEPKSGWRRALAITSWILAIASEVCAILYLVGKINITSLNKTTWLIIFIAIDLIFFVIGSLLWKKANHITPKSEKNKFTFWIWNNLGTILSVLAFLPLIIFVLMNKDMDKKSKSIVAGVAAVALAIAGITGYDFNPVSSEKVMQEQANIESLGYKEVYWAPNSKKYHVDPDCSYFSNSSEIYKGTVADAYKNGQKLEGPCSRCVGEAHNEEE